MTSKRPASRTLGDLLDEIATVTPSAEAIASRGERLDYAGLKTRADDFARALLAVGIRKGDRVAVLVTNRTEWIIAAFAAGPWRRSLSRQIPKLPSTCPKLSPTS